MIQMYSSQCLILYKIAERFFNGENVENINIYNYISKKEIKKNENKNVVKSAISYLPFALLFFLAIGICFFGNVLSQQFTEEDAKNMAIYSCDKSIQKEFNAKNIDKYDSNTLIVDFDKNNNYFVSSYVEVEGYPIKPYVACVVYSTKDELKTRLFVVNETIIENDGYANDFLNDINNMLK